jgi:hypothetical protein
MFQSFPADEERNLCLIWICNDELALKAHASEMEPELCCALLCSLTGLFCSFIKGEFPRRAQAVHRSRLFFVASQTQLAPQASMAA